MEVLQRKLEEYKAGEYIKMNDYKAFIPSRINYNWDGMIQNQISYWQKRIDKLVN